MTATARKNKLIHEGLYKSHSLGETPYKLAKKTQTFLCSVEKDEKKVASTQMSILNRGGTILKHTENFNPFTKRIEVQFVYDIELSWKERYERVVEAKERTFVGLEVASKNYDILGTTKVRWDKCHSFPTRSQIRGEILDKELREFERTGQW